MITPHTNHKLPKEFFYYQIVFLIVVFIITLPLAAFGILFNFFLCIPTIILIILFFNFWLDYKNFSFHYDEKQLEIRKGILKKSQKTIPFSAIQNTNLVSGVLMRAFGLEKMEIWTSSPSQIKISTSETERKPDGILYLKQKDAELLQSFIMDHG